ncbi:hypothetical protein [Piscinibacter gummiphilus]|uniref:Uncharacterized protein n=1 Tax=Piscinibacter gummiphilus TaxID=946333 RepID=A0A1W6L745_9BURK|nr:hypothetical protein [Piscinibacter gummiphilus]ARN20017.1 hypothetical protein A4W93_08870 [Piscinibacter gummiphilus]ATU64687.1 hypothetical protein CPZ87_08945 [Piscinibacter gummiphilus]GLS94881.1 hypothetical protein GCM10007918_21730 [Piscinibacter gummiphilus]
MPSSHALPGKARIRHVEGGQSTLYVDARHAQACAELWRGGEFTTIAVNENENPELKSLDFLEAFFPVARLHVMLSRRVDLSILESASLEWFFSNDGFNSLNDLSKFPDLEILAQGWKRTFDPSGAGPSLRRLALTGFRPEDGGLGEMTHLHQLSHLSLLTTSVISLDGLQAMPSLLSASFCSAPKLRDISALGDMRNLEVLQFEACKSLEGVADAVRSPALRELECTKCSALSSLSFIRELPALETFLFPDTDVIDGDMSPMLDHPSLNRVLFTKKKHFSMSYLDVMSHLRQRKGEPQ